MKPAPALTRVMKRNGTVVRYDRARIATAIFKALNSQGRPDLPLAESLAQTVERALQATYRAPVIPSVEDIQDVVESSLMESGLTRVARSYIIYRHAHALRRAARAPALDVADNIPYRIIYEVLRWNMDHECESVRSLNRVIRQGRFPALVRAAEERYRDELGRALAQLMERLDRVRLVIVAGPSSSGKTTTTARIGAHLAAAGRRVQTINIDHYFFDLARHPRDEFGDYDYETPQALDLDLISEHLAALLDGRAIRTPHYDFKTGRRTLGVHPLRLRKGEILLIDSLHGLYEAMTRRVPAPAKFRVYIETLGQLRAEDGTFMRWADNRLLRRMMRDKEHRNQQPLETIAHWHYVRRSELKHIIPFIRHADCLVNTALPYELPILRHRLLPYVRRAAQAYAADPRRRDAHIRATRVYDLLRPLKSVGDDSCVPADSILREFIGGSPYAC